MSDISYGNNSTIHDLSSSNQPINSRTYLYILCGIAAASIFINVYVLLSAKYLKRPISFNMVLSLSLAATDAWSGFLIVNNLLLNDPDIYAVLSPPACLLLTIEMFRLSSFATSVFHLLALALNHFLGIVFPIRHRSLTNNRFKAVVLSVLWVAPLILFFNVATLVPDEGFQSDQCENLTFVRESYQFRNVVCSVIFIPMLITFILYFVIVVNLRDSNRDPILSSSSSSCRTTSSTKSSRKLFGTMVLLMGTFVLGWLPSILVFLLLCSGCPLAMSENVNFALRTGSFSLTILKLFSNPLIYALRINELRRAMAHMTLYCCLCKSNATLLSMSQESSRRRLSSRQYPNNTFSSFRMTSPKTTKLPFAKSQSLDNRRRSANYAVWRTVPEYRTVLCKQNVNVHRNSFPLNYEIHQNE